MPALAIGHLSAQTGVTVETIRYYEKIGLLPRPARTAAGYRQYDEDDLRRLTFIRRGRSLGFSIEAIRALLGLAEHPDQPCHDADALACAHLIEIERRIEELGRLRDAVREMAGCHSDCVAGCRIIDTLTR